jgi:hypothetical protein
LASTPNVSSVAFTTHGNGLPYLPQNGSPRSEVFFVPQFGHARTEIGPVATSLGISDGCSTWSTAYRDPRDSRVRTVTAVSTGRSAGRDQCARSCCRHARCSAAPG